MIQDPKASLTDESSLEGLSLPELRQLFEETKQGYIAKYQDGAPYVDLRPFIRELKALSCAMDDARASSRLSEKF